MSWRLLVLLVLPSFLGPCNAKNPITWFNNYDCSPDVNNGSYSYLNLDQCYVTAGAHSIQFFNVDCPGDYYHIATYNDTGCADLVPININNLDGCFYSINNNSTFTAVALACGPVGDGPTISSTPTPSSTTPTPVTTTHATTTPATTTPATTTPATTTPATTTPANTTPANTSQPPVSSTGIPPPTSIPGGAIAGIVIGAVAAIGIIAGLLIFICIRERQRRRDRHSDPANLSPNPGPMMQMPASPPLVNNHTASIPPATLNTPLTQANIAAISPRSEVLPGESASQINIPGPALSQGSAPVYHPGTGLNTASQEHNGLGPLYPGPQYRTGSTAFSPQDPSSVMSPGSEFGSMPPVHAPRVTSYRPSSE